MSACHFVVLLVMLLALSRPYLCYTVVDSSVPTTPSLGVSVSAAAAAATKKELAKNTTVLLDQLLEGYDRRLRPGFGEEPTVVDVNLNIRSMGPISETDMAYQLDCYFRQSWVDRRLEFSGPNDKLVVAVNILDRLWMPDTHFFNGKRSYLHTVTTPNKLLRIHRDGRILYSMRITIKASCPMHLENFPMDTQTCPLQVGSHGYGETDMLYFWTYGEGNSIKMAPDVRLSQFDLEGFPQGNLTMYKPGGELHSVLLVNFHLKRNMGYFLINVYVPCSLLVVLSWVAFWINREATADRIALGVMTVLTMAFLGIDNRRDLPKVSYSTALDYFVGICFAFILATILEFAGVHFFTKHGSGEWFLNIPYIESDDEEVVVEEDEEVLEDRKTAPQSDVTFQNQHAATTNKKTQKMNGTSAGSPVFTYAKKHDAVSADKVDWYPPRKKENPCLKLLHCLIGNAKYRDRMRQSTKQGVNSVSKIDKTSRIMFPLIFVAFNVFYWLHYLEADGPIDMFSS